MKDKMQVKCDVLSCIQPTGDITLGNYFGAIKNWLKLQDSHSCVFGIVDLHAMTKTYEPILLKQYSDQMILDLLACGIDPAKSTLFVQSLVPEHVELSWILSTCAPYGDLDRQFKTKYDSKKSETNNAGLFGYPVLQAADILIYRAGMVPVGKDQKQHLELTRTIANRFNNRFGDFFPIPEVEFSETPKIMSLSDPSMKMSKSSGEKHFVRLFEEESILREKIKSAVTDDGGVVEGEMSAGVESLFTLLKACDEIESYDHLMADYNNGQLRYSELKAVVADALVVLTAEMRYNRSQIQGDTSLVNDTIREMSSKARKMAQETLFQVKELVGIKSISNF